MSTMGPLKVQRRVSLFLSFLFATVGFVVGLNALIKVNQERSYIYWLVSPEGIINISTHDVFASGAVITVICAFLSILSCVLCAFTWYPKKSQEHSFRVQSWAFFLCAAWLFATLVVYDYFFATRSAQISINLHGQHTPESVIQHLEYLLDFTHAYRNMYFLRLLAVIPWFAFILAVVAAVVLQLAAGRAEKCPISDNSICPGAHRII